MRNYIILNKNFSIKGDSKEKYLFNISNGKKYLLNKHQLNIIKKLNGTKTIKKIYNAGNQKELIKYLIKNLERLEAIQYSEHKIRSSRKDIINLSERPRLKEVHWELTSKCNLRCLHCYQVSYLYKKEEPSPKSIENILGEMTKLGIDRVSISGGEPFLKTNLLGILNKLESKNIRISSIFTNGTLISKGVLDKLKQLKSTINLNISLDGIKPQSMAIRGLRDPIKQKEFLNLLIKNIKLAKTKGFPIRINTILNKYNVNSLLEMFNFFNKELKGIFWSIGFPRALGSCVYNKSELLIDQEKIFKSCEDLIKVYLQYQQDNKAKIELKIQHLFHKNFLDSLNYYKKNSSICNYDNKNAMCCIKPNGDILPCPVLLDFKTGNTSREKLSTVWKSRRMQKIKNIKIKDLAACKNCKYLRLCGGGCRASAYANYKNLYSKDPLACNAMQYFEKNIKPILKRYAKHTK